MKIAIILGTRPEIMKMSPIYLSERSPFIIKAYRYDEDLDKELEIHFWYEVRGMTTFFDNFGRFK